MKKTMLITILLGLALGTSLSACNLEAACDPSALVSPTNLSPNSPDPIDDLMPQLSWSYPEECEPESFLIEVNTGWIYSHDTFRAQVSGSERTVVLGPYQPGTKYLWRVDPISDSVDGDPTYGSFIIGPLCEEADRAFYTAPRLLHPEEGQVISTTSTISHRDGTTTTAPMWSVEWENTMACLPPEGYTVVLSDEPGFFHPYSYTVPIPGGSSYDTNTWNFLYHPGGEIWHDCQRWFWRVLIGELSGAEGGDPYSTVYAISETRSIIINTTGTFCMPDFGLILTPIPWRELPFPGELPPATPTGVPTALTREPANCRSGPALDYPILSILPAGGQFEIRGRNTDGDSWQVFDPEIDDTCWVNADLVEVIGIADLVEIVMPPPPPLIGPTDTPASIVDCSKYNGDLWQSCNLDPACYWDPTGGTGNGECKNR